MLQSLHVKNLALIDESEVEFTSGLNILSGETGAGKSIIIGSIGLALGEKIPKEMVREGADYALVELVFTVTDARVREQLLRFGVYPENDEVIISRRIVNGRGACKVNAESMPASRMKEIAAALIDIHGQHEHQSLLSKKKHLEILDDYAKEEIGSKKEALAETYRQYRKLVEELAEADRDGEDRVREISFLEYELHEIEEARLREGEDEELEAEYSRFCNGKRIMEAMAAAYGCTGGGMESATELLGRALRELMSVSEYDDRVKNCESQLAEIDNLLNDFNREMADYIEETEFDEATFYEIEKRLDLLNHLKSKYGGSVAEVMKAAQEKEERLKKLANYDTYLAELKEHVKAAEMELQKLCEEVSKIRQSRALKLSADVTESLKDLNFLDVRFQMEFERMEHYTANGYDDAEFMISTNPGEPLKPLGKVASGGELSRIMLAIKTILASQDAIDTLIFDEIDSGISGRTAQMVSEKMSFLGKNHQIICITHLPQIAAMADAHYLIQKSVENQSTVSHIRRLKEEDSVEELARMLGGVEITDTVLKSAEEMKELARQKKERHA